MSVDDVFRLAVPARGYAQANYAPRMGRPYMAEGHGCRTITPGIDLRVLEIGETETLVLITVDFSEWWISNDLMP